MVADSSPLRTSPGLDAPNDRVSTKAGQVHVIASMEPRPCGRGNARLREPGREPGGGFNGATTLRSWKHSARDYRSGLGAASMEPRPCGRGNYRAYPAGGVRAVRFNGATTLRSWKLPAGPRAGRRPKGFNGATTLRSWKRWRARKSCWTQLRLQWSHDLAVVETSSRPSCRPPPKRLQWSHDLAVVETSTRTRIPCWRCCCFNGATTLRSWKPESHATDGRRP